jgi:hypothetical protein
MALTWVQVTSKMDSQAQRERHLNDRLRREMPHGSVRIRGEAKQFSNNQLLSITQLIQSFDNFKPDSDVSELHDNGAVEFEGIEVVWQIEANGKRVETAPCDASNEAAQRSIMIMLAEEC